MLQISYWQCTSQIWYYTFLLNSVFTTSVTAGIVFFERMQEILFDSTEIWSIATAFNIQSYLPVSNKFWQKFYIVAAMNYCCNKLSFHFYVFPTHKHMYTHTHTHTHTHTQTDWTPEELSVVTHHFGHLWLVVPGTVTDTNFFPHRTTP